MAETKDIGLREMDLYNRTATETMKALVEVLKTITQGKDKRFNDKKIDSGMKLILSHAKKGGQIKGSLMKDYEADTFEKQLREMRVPFAKMQIKGMGEKSEFVYLTRGRSENNDPDIPDDSYKVLKAYREVTDRNKQKEALYEDLQENTVLISVERAYSGKIKKSLKELEIPYQSYEAENGNSVIGVDREYESLVKELLEKIMERKRESEAHNKDIRNPETPENKKDRKKTRKEKEAQDIKEDKIQKQKSERDKTQAKEEKKKKEKEKGITRER